MFAVIVLVSSLAVAAKAQQPGRTKLITNIPFQFNVGNETLPAGEYTLLPVMADSSNVVLKIQGSDRKAGIMFSTTTVEGKPQNRTILVFHRYGDKYFFAHAWIEGEKFGLKAPTSRAERATQREFSAINMATESVSVSARR